MVWGFICFAEVLGKQEEVKYLNQNVFSRQIKNIAIAIGLAGLGIVTLFMPLLKYFSIVLWMAPLVIIARKYGYLNALITVVFSGLFLGFITLNMQIPDALFITGFITGTFGILMFIYTYCFNKQLNPLKSILIGTSFLALVQISILIMILTTSDFNLHKTIQGSFNQIIQAEEFQTSLQELEKEGISKEQIISSLKSLWKFLSMTLPSLILIDGLITALLAYLGLYFIQKKLKIKVLSELAFARWRIPWYGTWIFIVGLAIALLGDSFNFTYNKYVAILGYNIILSFIPIAILIGISVATYIYSNIQGLYIFKILLIIMIIFNLPLVLLILAIIGAFDPFIDIRNFLARLRERKED